MGDQEARLAIHCINSKSSPFSRPVASLAAAPQICQICQICSAAAPPPNTFWATKCQKGACNHHKGRRDWCDGWQKPNRHQSDQPRHVAKVVQCRLPPACLAALHSLAVRPCRCCVRNGTAAFPDASLE